MQIKKITSLVLAAITTLMPYRNICTMRYLCFFGIRIMIR